MRRIAVIGGGPAGMMAAGSAAENGAAVTLYEKNEKLGKKLHITGKGRCNLTNNTDVQGLLSHVVTNPRFLNSAFRTMDSYALTEFFTSLGVPLKTERGGRVFPESDKADDINKALIKYLRDSGVKVKLNNEVNKISFENERFKILTDTERTEADAVIIATGGLSYPSTGSTGDGFIFAKKLGHTVSPAFPALVPLITEEKFDLEGLSLKNVRLTVKLVGGKKIFEETGEMLFTENGVSGPLVLSASTHICDKFRDKPVLSIDLKPALSHEQLDTRILRDFSAYQNKNFANALDDLLPKRLISTIISLSNIPPDKKVNAVTRAERLALVNLLKNFTLTAVESAGFREAVITKGGVSVREINPSTLCSKIIPNLYFAGEVIDTDALTGGYNLQIAFSTGRLAGISAAATQ